MPTHPASAYRGSAARYTGASREPSPARCRSPTGHRGGARGAPPPPRPTDAGDGGQVHAPRYRDPEAVLANVVPRSTSRSPESAYRGALPGTPGHDPALGHRSSSPTPGPNGRSPRRPGCRRTRTEPRPDRPPGFNISRPRPRTAIRRWAGAPGRTANNIPARCTGTLPRRTYRMLPGGDVPGAPGVMLRGGRRTASRRWELQGRGAARGAPANSATRSTPSASSSPMSRCAGAGGARALGESDASNPPGPGTAGGVYPVAWTGTSPGTFGPGRHPDVPLPGWRPYLPARSGPVPPDQVRHPWGLLRHEHLRSSPPGTWPPYSTGYLAALVGEGATNISLSR